MTGPLSLRSSSRATGACSLRATTKLAARCESGMRPQGRNCAGSRPDARTVHQLPRTAVASPDGRILVAGAWDGTIWLWDVEKQHEVRRLAGHVASPAESAAGASTAAVTSVALSANGRYCLSGGNDGTVRLWDLSSGAEL